MEKSLAGVVVLFNPANMAANNINTYINYVDKLFIIDNSSTKKFESQLDSLRCHGNVEYIANSGNEGVAAAINKAANLARNMGYSWLLTMDQDSSFSNINEMISYIHNDSESRKVGLYSPFHDTGTRIIPKEDVSYVTSVMTSGNILNLNSFFEIGGADDRFFIDCIDHDICELFIQKKFLIKRLNFCKLTHELGNGIEIIKGREITNHSPFRRYYITRNTLYYVEKHFIKNPIGSLKYLKSFLGNTYSCLRYESDRKTKLKFIIKGAVDYIRRRTGALR